MFSLFRYIFNRAGISFFKCRHSTLTLSISYLCGGFSREWLQFDILLPLTLGLGLGLLKYSYDRNGMVTRSLSLFEGQRQFVVFIEFLLPPKMGISGVGTFWN